MLVDIYIDHWKLWVNVMDRLERQSHEDMWTQTLETCHNILRKHASFGCAYHRASCNLHVASNGSLIRRHILRKLLVSSSPI